jgi:hypothetical protein
MPTLSFMWLRHKGACLILLLLLIEIPCNFVNENLAAENRWNNVKVCET